MNMQDTNNNNHNNTEIHTACKNGDWETFQTLVSNGANIKNYLGQFRNNLLHFASQGILNNNNKYIFHFSFCYLSFFYTQKKIIIHVHKNLFFFDFELFFPFHFICSVFYFNFNFNLISPSLFFYFKVGTSK